MIPADPGPNPIRPIPDDVSPAHRRALLTRAFWKAAKEGNWLMFLDALGPMLSQAVLYGIEADTDPDQYLDDGDHRPELPWFRVKRWQ